MQTVKKITHLVETEDSDIVTPQEHFVETVNNCPICGTILEFEYRTQAYDNAVTEKAHCGECQIRIRDQHHAVH